MTLTQKLAYNTFIQVLGKIFVTLASVVIVIYLTRYLGPEGYGQYTIVLTYLGLFVVLADLGLSVYIAKEVPKKEHSADKIVGNVLGLRMVLAVATLILAGVVIVFMPYEPIIKYGVWVASFSMFFMLMTESLKGVYQVNLSMDKFSYADVVGRFFTLGFTILFIKLNLGLISILVAYTLGNMLILIINIIWVQAHIKVSFKFEYSFWKKIFKEAIPLGLVVVSGAIYFRLGTIMLSLFKSTEDVGIFGAAYKVIEILLTFPGMFVGLILPLFAQFIEKNPIKFKNIFQKSFNLMFIWIVPIIVLGVLLAPEIINIIGGSQFEKASTPLVILMFALIFSFASSPLGSVVVALGKQAELAWRNFSVVLIVIAINLILIPLYSYIGTAITLIISEMVLLFLSLFLVKKHLGYLPNLQIVPKVLLSGLAMSAIVYFLTRYIFQLSFAEFSSLSFWTRISIFLIVFIAGSVIYLATLYLLKGYSKRSVDEILGRD